ncbi:MAG: hypothetical protein WAU88_12110 [Candidatus Zixiibacteriota bacterium]
MMRTGRLILIHALCLVGLAIGLSGVSYRADCATVAPKLNGLVLPIPTRPISITGIDSLYTRNGYRLYEFWLAITASGKVTSVHLTEILAESKAALIRNLFSKVQFTPCVKNDTARSCRLPVRFLVGTDSADCSIRLPIGTDSCIDDIFLYSEAVKTAGFQPIGLKTFPWFHATFPEHDSLNILPFALISLKVGARGEVRERKLVSTNFENYGRQVLNATSWGKYLPAKWNSRAISSTGFLLISFFPTLPYPSVPYPPKNPDSLSYHKQLSLRFLTDTAGPMIVPIPREAARATYHIPPPPEFRGKTMVVQCSIDTCGILKMTGGRNESDEARKFYKSLSAQIRLYPAMDVAGRCQSFNGIARVTVGTEPIVRIEYLWLP